MGRWWMPLGKGAGRGASVVLRALLCWAFATSAHATLVVSQSVSASTIVVGERVRLTITISNSDVQVDGALLVNSFPPQLRLYDPTFPGYVAPATTCASATLTPGPGAGAGGADVLTVSGFSVPGNAGAVDGTCAIQVDITSFQGGSTWTNVINPTDLTPNAATVAQQSILVNNILLPAVSKNLGGATLTQGLSRTATITFTNPNSSVNIPFTSFTDTLPTNLEVLGIVGNTCGSSTSFTAGSVTLSGGAIPAGSPGTCNLQFTIRGVLPSGSASASGTNTIAAGDIGNTRGVTYPGASTNITVNSPIVLNKGFSVSPLTAGTDSLLTVRIRNNSAAALTGVGLADVVGTGWPAPVRNSGAIGSANLTACGAGATLLPGIDAGVEKGFTLANATIASGAECVISYPVTSDTPGFQTNSIPVGNVANTQGVTNDQGFISPARSATLEVRNNALTVSKAFSPTTVAPGNIVTFAVSVTSFSLAPQTSVTFTDVLPTGMVYVDATLDGQTPTISGGCSFSAPLPTPLTGSPQFTFDFPSAAAGGTTCVVRFTARVPNSATPGTSLTNASFGAGNGTVSGSSGAVSFSVVNPLVVTKTFDGVAARQLFQGSPSVVEIVLTNNNFSALANVAFTDTLPGTPGVLRVANPAGAVSTCGGTVTANPGDTSFSLSGGTLAARSSTSPFAAGACSVRVNVVGGTVGVHSNSIPAFSGGNAADTVSATGTISNVPGTTVRNLNTTTATLEYLPALTVAKTFLTNPVQTGGTSRVRITLGNTGSGLLGNVSVTDPLTGTGLAVAATPNASTTCAGPVVLSAPVGGNSASLTGAELAGGGSCDFLFDVTTTTSTPSVNTLPVGSVTASGGVANTNAISATLNKITTNVNLTKAFAPTTLSGPGSVSRLTISIDNLSATPLTDLGVVDNLPSGMVVAPIPDAATTCAGGIVNAAADATSVSLSGGSVGGNASCTVSVNITSAFVGTLNNTLAAGAVTNTQGVTNANPFTANVASLAGLGVEKFFEPGAVAVGQPARLVIRIRNSLPQALTNITSTDNFPAGLVVATPANATTTCAGATLSTTASSIGFSGAQLAAGPSVCEIRVSVRASAPGTYVNTIPGGTVVANDGAVTNPQPGPTATLFVLAPPAVTKAFAASPVAPGAPNRLTVTITNPNAGQALTGVSLRDNLPTGLFVAQVPNASTTCAGGAVSALASATSAQVAGATVPASGSCSFSFDTVSNTPGLYTNTIPTGALSADQGVSNPDPASAQVRVLQPPTLSKAFVPPTVSPGGVSRLTITLGNANASAQTLQQALTDNLPAGVTVASPPAVGGSCTTASVTATAGGTQVIYANGASIPAGGCTIEVNVTASSAGTYTNQFLSGALRTTAGSNGQPATAVLRVSPLGSISGRAYIDANNNGAYDAGEPPLAGQSVSLIRSLDSVVLQKTTTDSGGVYVFSELVDTAAQGSDYSVRFLRSGSDVLGAGGSATASPETNALSGTLPGRITAATTAESSIQGGTGLVGTPNNSSVDFISRRSNIQLNLAGGNVASSVGNNFGEVLPAEVSGRVYRDDNNNGVANGTEPGIAGVTITLQGIDDLNQSISRTAVTDADGNYRFTGLRPSCAPLAAPGCPGYVVTQGSQPAATVNGQTTPGAVLDASSGATTGTAGTGSNSAPLVSYGGPPTAYVISAGTSRIGGIVLPPNARAVNNNFGEVASDRSISGRVFTDANGDGVANGTDAGVGSGATGTNNLAQTLTLTGTDIAGNPVSLTTDTDANGSFSFAGVPPGTSYTLTCSTCAAPAGLVNSTTPLAWPGSAGGAAGGTQASPQITGIALTGGNTASVDNFFTKTPPAQQIGGVVYFDPDNSGGLFGAGDAAVAGVTLSLLDAGGAVLGTTTTNAAGQYLFSSLTLPSLLPGASYQVRLDAPPAGTTAGTTTPGNVGGTPTGVATAAGVSPAIISGIALGAAQQSVQNNFPLVANIQVAGRVYEDRDLGGSFNGADAGIAGNTLTLLGTDSFGNSVTRFTTTDAAGEYRFEGLAPGTYTVRQTQPLNFTSLSNSVGPVTGGTAGAVGALGGATETVGLSFSATPGAALQVNFAETSSTATLRGYKAVRIVSPAAAAGVSPGAEVVWQVIYQNDGATPLTLDISDTLPDFMTRTGAPALSSQSGGGGSVALNPGYTGLAGGDVLGTATLPTGGWVAINVPVTVTAGATTARLNQARAGGAAVRTDTVDATTPAGGAGQPPAGVIDPASLSQSAFQTSGIDATGVPLSALPATLSGFVWRDNNADRQRDPADTPIANWAVEVLDANNTAVLCRAVPSNSAQGCVTMPDGRSLFRTGADGSYGVIGLVPGSYRIAFRDPANNVVFGTPQNTGGDPSSRLSPSREFLEVTLVAGANLQRQDLPLDPSGVVYDSATRLPVDGALVRFCGPPGFDPATMLVGGSSYTNQGNCAQLTTGPSGFYQYLLAPGATPGEYSLSVSAPNYAPTPSGSIPPAPGVLTPAGPSPLLIQAQAGPPQPGQPTTYHLRFNLAPGVPDVIHNHIPLDPFAGGGLFLQKNVAREVVELGDSVQYTLRVVSPNGAATNVTITDRLPAGLRLIPGTVARDGTVVADPAGAPGPVLSFDAGSFAANTTVTITYRVRVGVGAQQGDGINRAQASGTVGGTVVSSNRAQARIRITGGVFFQEACVLGKVFVDCNGNRIQDAEEVGIPGVRFYLQDGTHLTSDSEGKYSVCGLPARTSAMRVDVTTLPAGSELVTGSNRNALDAGSLFLDLKFGELHRADFIEGSCSPAVRESVNQRRRTGQVTAPMVDPPGSTQAPPAPRSRVFRSGDLPAQGGVR
ncbi:SdrD B-like domain-containing protein [Hydrogenophaga sp. XSHU_21]